MPFALIDAAFLDPTVKVGGLTRGANPPVPGQATVGELDSTVEDDESRRGSLRHQVREYLRAQVISGQFEPGQLYSLSAIADELGVSTTPAREGLLDLASTGLVEIRRNRGFIIKAVSDADKQNILMLLRLLEVPTLREVASRRLAVDDQELTRLLAAAKKASTAGQWTDFVVHERALRLRLISALGNQRLLTIIAGLRDQARILATYRLTPELLSRLGDDSEALLSAVLRGDANAAEKIALQELS
jgi:DNA-binding GntR family transcriptional regulator